MQKPLLDNNNQVVNIIEIEDSADYTPPAGLTLAAVDPTAIIGGSYDPATDLYGPPSDTTTNSPAGDDGYGW